jgi:signal transduction histidine kinase
LLPPISAGEKERLAALYKTELLDSDYEEEFDEIVALAAQLYNTPISTITLIDADRQWFKAKVGMEKREDSRDISFCAHAIASGESLVVEDATLDSRFADNPLVTGDPNIRYYAGVPLTTSEGYKLGTLCVIDRVARQQTHDELFALRVLARKTSALIELRMKYREVEAANTLLSRLNSITAHDIRGPIGSLKQLIAFARDGVIDAGDILALLPAAEKQLDNTLSLLNNLVDWGKLQLSKDIKMVPNNLQEVVENCLHQVQLQAALKQNQLINNVPRSVVINGDSGALGFILRNVLSNAVKFTSNGFITVAYQQNGNSHHVSITDTGIGMDITARSSVRMPGNLLQRDGTGAEKGSGLGLKLVQEYLGKMKGQITIDSEPGKGTTVHIFFPAL